MFPTGTPGIALLALRFLVAATFVVDGTTHLAMVNSFWIFVGFALPAILLCLGFLTPYCSAAYCFVELYILLFVSGSDSFHLVVSVAVAGILTVLGPGGYSIDARIFGRRLLTVRPRR
jgi:hypothetical protein